ncbi:MAG: ATP-binding protein [Dehalococcoidia bacterium]|nr:ATP-binding protein [Dehalococcoidia bacterium]
MTADRLGIVVAGSLTGGVEVKLDCDVSVEERAVGRYVVIEGQKLRFLGMVTDVSLETIDDEITSMPPVSDEFIAQVISGTSTYGKLHVLPMLAIGGDAMGLLDGPKTVKTVPAHFSRVREATEQDIEVVFGKEDERHFYVGNPLDMETKVCLDLPLFVTRCNGVFGKSGTGKTFLTRLLLIGIIQKGAAVNLVFDMHNEYGWKGSFEGAGREVKALKQILGSRVAVFTLDEESSRRRKVSTDAVVEIGYDEVEPEDVELLRQTLNLTQPAVEAVYALAREFGARNWLKRCLEMDTGDEATKALLDRLHIHEQSVRNLRRGLDKLARLGFLTPKARESSVKRILDYLGRGINVVLEFGKYKGDSTANVLVANTLTRRIHDQYRRWTEQAQGEGAAPPQPLVITIEEAHLFLNHEVMDQTIFGTIAREMRKYNVTLLIVDQRPSGIDEEVMSQIGTRITYRLDNERDIDNVLTGVSNKGELKTVLAKLEPKQQSLIFGHAVPMPIVIRTRDYEKSYQEFAEAAEIKRKAENLAADLWG